MATRYVIPVETIPSASPRRFSKYWQVAVTVAVYNNPHPKPKKKNMFLDPNSYCGHVYIYTALLEDKIIIFFPVIIIKGKKYTLGNHYTPVRRAVFTNTKFTDQHRS